VTASPTRTMDSNSSQLNVNEVIRSYRIKEDGAIAYQLQEQEINDYYNQNKHRNALMRIDYPTALSEQLKEQLEAKKVKDLRTMEEQNAFLIAQKIQEEEMRKKKKPSPKKVERIYEELESPSPVPPRIHHDRASSSSYSFEQDFISKCSVDEPEAFDINATMSEARSLTTREERLYTLRQLGLSPQEIAEIEHKIQQELQDEALARKLQQESVEPLSVEELDRKIAMEAQDKEVAKMLYNREKAKLKKAKEKARLKKELRLRESQASPLSTEGIYMKPPMPEPQEDHYVSPLDMLSTKSSENIYLSPLEDENLQMQLGAARSRQGFRLPEELEAYEYSSAKETVNSEANPVPPYMPIQGTRRTSPTSKKKNKERCSQQ